jgi:hypothetical protein
MRVKRLLAASCKPPSPTEQMDAILSWVGTTVLLGEAWLRHTTPDAYTRQTLTYSREQLSETGQGLLKSLPSGIDSAALDSAVTSSGTHIAQLARLVEAKNSPAFTQQLDSLRLVQQRLKQISSQLEASQ